MIGLPHAQSPIDIRSKVYTPAKSGLEVFSSIPIRIPGWE